MATLVAQAVPPGELFAAVNAEVGRLLGVDLTGMVRYHADWTVTVLAAWAAVGEIPDVRGRMSLEGDSTSAMIARTGRPAREDNWADVSGPIAELIRDRLGIKSSVGSPIVVEGRVWGALVVHSTHGPLAAGIEERLDDFTELVATAISNSEARAEVERLAEEQAGLRRVATLVAHESPGADVFAAVADEVGRLLRVEDTGLIRYEDDGTVTVVAGWGKLVEVLPVGTNMSLEGTSVSALVLRTERPARIDDYSKADGPMAVHMRSKGVRSAVGTPILVRRTRVGRHDHRVIRRRAAARGHRAPRQPVLRADRDRDREHPGAGGPRRVTQRGSWPRPTLSGGGWSAICTTGRSNAWFTRSSP